MRLSHSLEWDCVYGILDYGGGPLWGVVCEERSRRLEGEIMWGEGGEGKRGGTGEGGSRPRSPHPPPPTVHPASD
ncbi:unnamed protein product [Arctogadus glacialis]